MTVGLAPVIVIGMHRSGTSMLARLLAESGVFLGQRLQPEHHEARLFQSLNTWLLRHESGGWDAPEAVRLLLDDPAARAVAVDYVRFTLSSPRAVSFLGPVDYVRHRGVRALDRPWGWKDPRSTFTLPIWLEVFPDAKVLHVVRHGVDVAESLRTRQQRMTEQAAAVFARRRWRYLLWAKDSGFTRGLRFADLDEGLSLWERYTAEARSHVEALGARAHEVRYEELLAEPRRHLDEVLRFCGATPEREVVERATAGVDATRAFPFTASAELRCVAQRHEARLARFGYGPAGVA